MSEQQRELTKDTGERMPESVFQTLDLPPLAPDILRGVRDITVYLYGTSDRNAIRSVYHLTEKSNTIPTFKLGSMTCARKSSIRATVWMQEKRAWKGEQQELLVRMHVLLSGIITLMSAHGKNATDERDHAKLLALLMEAATTIQRVLQIKGA